MKKFYVRPLVALLAIIFCFSSCKKDSPLQPKNPPAVKKSQNSSAVADPLVLTPGGWLPQSHVHFLPKGHHLDARGSHVLDIEDASGKIMADLGEKHLSSGNLSNPQQSPLSTNFNNFHNLSSTTNPVIPGGAVDGWVASSQWYGGSQITFCSTVWVVPGAPSSTTHGQTIFIFNGLEGNGDILQPVLQWGSSHAGGGNYWSVGNWYGWGNNNYFAYTSLTTVSSGTVLEGIISKTGTNPDGSNNFNVLFNNYGTTLSVIEGTTHGGEIGGVGNQTVTFPYIYPETFGFETIESYNNVNFNGGNGVVSSTDYPTQMDVPMTAIYMYINGSPATNLSWTPVTGTWASVGEHANIINNSSSGTQGEVDLYFHPQLPVFTYPSYTFTQGVTVPTPSPVHPTNNETKIASYSISPALPAGLSFNTTSGIITGTPLFSSPLTSYTVTGTNSVGSSHVNPGFSVASTPTGTYTFGVETTNASASYFYIIVNTSNISGPRGTAPQYQINNVAGTCTLLSNSTVVMQITSGHVPTSATLSGPFGNINGVISGNNITFSNVNLSFGSSCGLTIN